MRGLALQVQEALKRDPHAGDLYVSAIGDREDEARDVRVRAPSAASGSSINWNCSSRNSRRRRARTDERRGGARPRAGLHATPGNAAQLPGRSAAPADRSREMASFQERLDSRITRLVHTGHRDCSASSQYWNDSDPACPQVSRATACNPLCLSQIKSAHIDDAIHRGPDGARRRFWQLRATVDNSRRHAIWQLDLAL